MFAKKCKLQKNHLEQGPDDRIKRLPRIVAFPHISGRGTAASRCVSGRSGYLGICCAAETKQTN